LQAFERAQCRDSPSAGRLRGPFSWLISSALSTKQKTGPKATPRSRFQRPRAGSLSSCGRLARRHRFGDRRVVSAVARRATPMPRFRSPALAGQAPDEVPAASRKQGGTASKDPVLTFALVHVPRRRLRWSMKATNAHHAAPRPGAGGPACSPSCRERKRTLGARESQARLMPNSDAQVRNCPMTNHSNKKPSNLEGFSESG
jgi:hypothetical protein